MWKAKDIVVKVIPSSIANDFVRKVHYSHKVVPNSNLHFGVFLGGQLHGVMSYGPSMLKKQLIGLVRGTQNNNFIELNRMAFDSMLPRNSESRALSISFRLLKKYAPQIKWIVSFADATQCGDGTIYRASGFVLTLIKPNEATARLPDGSLIHKMTLSAHPNVPQASLGGKCYYDYTDGKHAWGTFLQRSGAKLLEGWQLRYLYFLDSSWRKRLTVKEIPFSRIDELKAGMYKGKKITLEERHIDNYEDS